MTDEPTDPDAASTPTEYEVPEWLSLEEDERIQWVGEPVPVSIVGTAVWGLVLTVVLIGFLILLMLPFSWLSIKNTDYVVTNKALYVKKGVLSTNIESVSLDKIQNTEYSQSFWGKQFGFGSIDVSTAGSSGAEISLQNIENARDVRETITSLGNQYTSRSRGSNAAGEESTGATATDGTAEGMDELLEELRATRRAMERIERRLSDGSTAEAESVAADEDTPR